MIGKRYIFKGNRISPSQYMMMVMLRNGPMYGYEIIKSIRDEFRGLWGPQTGAVYPALKRLEEQGLLNVTNRDGKDYYDLSPEGETWMWEIMDSMSEEVRFLSRYVDVLAQAAMERISDIDDPGQSINKALPWQLLHLVDDLDNPSVRLSTKRMVKGMLEQKLRELENEISKLEEEGI
jgi:DNA-binding PadR family transcriptional regulator